MLLYLGLEQLYGLLGALEGGVGHDLEQALISELLLLAVLRLVETVGVDEEWLVGNICYLLAFVLQSWPHADGGVGQHIDELGTEYGRVMSCVAEVEVARLEVDESEEHRDEHHQLVVLARECVVDACGNLCGHHLLCCECAEESCGLCHEE